VPVLHVEDAARAVAWYGRLGFVKEWEHQFEPGFPWFVSVARGPVRPTSQNTRVTPGRTRLSTSMSTMLIAWRRSLGSPSMKGGLLDARPPS
jgi:catechol 2,3-dioxygenase-like lactoylglutathione lyase family enzyme